LSGCDSIKNTLGMDHYTPDEFEVSSNPPLTVPTDFSLRPPKDASCEKENTAADGTCQKVYTAVFKEKPKQTTVSTQSDKAVLNHLNETMPADASIRKKVQEESHVMDDNDNRVMARLKRLPAEIKGNLGSLNSKEAKDTKDLPKDKQSS
ncbi:MAG TPA: DUF3035 domain-containing protein, partial [Alphaproteobacteria bacterium]|nr:DUF3035 domain-containing protein [Alphaproteobacteria bacterium]